MEVNVVFLNATCSGTVWMNVTAHFEHAMWMSFLVRRRRRDLPISPPTTIYARADPFDPKVTSSQPGVHVESRVPVRRDQRHVPTPPGIPAGDSHTNRGTIKKYDETDVRFKKN